MTSNTWTLEKIVSGGQTGVDRAGLDAAMTVGIPVGGWIPKGRRTEDGPLDVCYPLMETRSPQYRVRTGWNVRDTDGTLILTIGVPEGGTAHTVQKCHHFNKPVLVVDLEAGHDLDEMDAWIIENRIRVLNIAGPRASKQPTIYNRACSILQALFRRFHRP